MFSLQRFLRLVSDRVLVRRALAAFLVLGAFMVVVLAQRDVREESAVRRGDFPAFWSMAVIARGPQPHRLYDLELQRQVQNAAWPSLGGAVLPAAYPPQVAFLVRPLASLDHRVARLVWTGLSLTATFLAIYLFVRRNARIRWAPWMVFGSLCTFSPMLRGILGGQVLAVVLLLFAITATLERRNSLSSDVLLGVVLGLWLCKPYYALCALVVPVMQRRWVTLFSFAAVAVVSWQVATSMVGPGWFAEWSAFAQSFGVINIEINAHQMPNVWAQLYRVYGEGARGGLVWWSAVGCAYGACATGVFVLLGWPCVRALISAPRRYGDLILSLVLALVVVLMPQVNFYDLGIIACVVVSLFRPERWEDWWFAGASVLLSQCAVSPPFGAPVHFLLSIGGVAYLCLRVRERVGICHDAPSSR